MFTKMSIYKKYIVQKITLQTITEDSNGEKKFRPQSSAYESAPRNLTTV